MDQNLENNQPPKANNYQYQWLSQLRDMQPGIFGPEAASNTEDNPMSKIDSTLFTEGTPQTSVDSKASKDTGYPNDLPINQLFQWPTMSGYVTNPTTNGNSRLTEADWPSPRDVQPTATETNYPTDPIQKDRNPIKHHRYSNNDGNHNLTNKSNIGPTQSQADFQRKQRNQQDQNIPTEDYPYIMQYRECLQAKGSQLVNNKNPMAPIGTPATSAGPGIMSTDTV